MSVLRFEGGTCPQRAETRSRRRLASRNSEPMAPPWGHVVTVPLVSPGGAATRTPGLRPTELYCANVLGRVPMVGWAVNGKQSKSKWFLFLHHTGHYATSANGGREVLTNCLGDGANRPRPFCRTYSVQIGRGRFAKVHCASRSGAV